MSSCRGRANVRVFSVPLTGDAFDFDHDDYLLEKYCRLSNPAWVCDLQALADQINEAIPECSVPIKASIIFLSPVMVNL